jgi:hypothetical protein
MSGYEINSLFAASGWFFFNSIVSFVLYKVIYKESPWVGYKKLLKREELGSDEYRARLEAKQTEREEAINANRKVSQSPDDYWDADHLDYATGEITSDPGPAVRHPKNRNRAYSGGA